MRLSMRVAAAALAAATHLGCGESRHSAEPVPERVVQAPVVAVSASSLEQAMQVTGTVEPARRSSPGTILAGRILSVEKREGERVRAGDTLAVVESGDAAARVAQAEAAVAAARVAEQNARRMRERMERLVARQAASQKDLEDAVGGHEGAVASLRAAEEGVRSARVYLDYASVRAPFDGVVVRRLVEAGDMAGPGMPLYVIDEVSRMKVEATVPESLARGLSAGAPVTVSIDGAAGDPRAATLAEILPASDPATRTVTARVLLDNRDGALRPGAFARVTFPGASGREGVSIPAAAVVRRGPLSGVFVVDDGGVARLRWLTLGEPAAERVEVLTGLQDGERIVAVVPPELQDGNRVEAAR